MKSIEISIPIEHPMTSLLTGICEQIRGGGLPLLSIISLGPLRYALNQHPIHRLDLVRAKTPVRTWEGTWTNLNDKGIAFRRPTGNWDVKFKSGWCGLSPDELEIDGENMSVKDCRWPDIYRAIDQRKATRAQSINSAPRDGTTIVGIYEHDRDSDALIFWSDRPVCMAGQINGGQPAGWAIAPEDYCDTNLPVDEPTHWHPYEGE